jgi:hypothetical protein
MVKALKELHPDSSFIPSGDIVEFCDKSDINKSFDKIYSQKQSGKDFSNPP